MAGGTGGHVFPGLAIARLLRDHGVEVHWLGTQQGLESRLVPEANIPLHLVKIKGVRGKGFMAKLSAPFAIFTAVRQSLRVMRDVNPDAVMGLGGFVSGPGGLAAWLTRRPLIIHEQNAKAGLTNKWLSRFSKRVLQGFPGAFQSRAQVMDVGNPVRQEIENLPPPNTRFQSSVAPFRLLVLGGSLGAQALNTLVPKAIAQLDPSDRPEIWHQTGEKHFEMAKNAYETLGVTATITPFIQDMAHAYGWASMVLCRAGALTVAELCAAGLGAIFVPFPFAVDDHQTANAHFMVQNKAALCIQQTELTEQRLADMIKQFSRAPDQRLAMAEAAYSLRKVNVAETVYQILCDVVTANR